MPLQSYFTNVLTTAHQLVILTSKFNVDLASGVVTTLEGKRVGVVAQAGNGKLTITLPQIFRNVVGIYSHVVDPALSGAKLVITSDVTNVGSKSQFTATLTKLTGGAPTAVTTGVFTVGLQVVAAA